VRSADHAEHEEKFKPLGRRDDREMWQNTRTTVLSGVLKPCLMKYDLVVFARTNNISRVRERRDQRRSKRRDGSRSRHGGQVAPGMGQDVFWTGTKGKISRDAKDRRPERRRRLS
jgi:hypothetical protein